jgi:DNA-binding NtrC family response regulator
MNHGAQKTALVISADSKIRDRIALTLSYEGFAIKVSDNHRNGLQILSEFPPDFLLIDVGVPDLDLNEFEQSMLAHNPMGRMVLITPTADVKAALDSSKNRHVLRAPFDAAALLNIVSDDRPR